MRPIHAASKQARAGVWGRGQVQVWIRCISPTAPDNFPRRREGRKRSANEPGGCRGNRWNGLSLNSTRCCEAGLATSGTPVAGPFQPLMDLCEDACAEYCSSRTSAKGLEMGRVTHIDGRMPFSLSGGCSPLRKPTRWRANPDEATTDWRAVCGNWGQQGFCEAKTRKTARAVRRVGRREPSRSLSHAARSVVSLRQAGG